MRIKFIILGIGGLFILLANMSPRSQAAPAVMAEAPSYTKDIRPFLKKYCVECHQPGLEKAGVSVKSYTDLTEVRGKKKRRMVVAGDPDSSKLLQVMEGRGKPMPPRKYGEQPTRDEVKIVREWIKAGAADDSAKKATD